MTFSSKTLGFGLLILLGLILAFSPVDKMSRKPVTAEQLIKEITTKKDFVQPEDLAHWIIDKDPGFQVIDVRSKDDYTKYHIPGSVSIPLEKLVDAESRDYIYANKMLILTSNGNTNASQTWIFMKQLGYKEVYILSGGMNYWVDVFSNPNPPEGAYTDDELFTYQFRKAAGPVMMGTAVATSSEVKIEEPAPVKRSIRMPKKKRDEGC
ncbi:MAG: rhodanese-like domain-containing protein [Calditrichaceae bacterium]